MKHKHSEIIKAWADGAEIQCSERDSNYWVAVQYPDWNIDLNYRIKPEKDYPKTQMSDYQIDDLYCEYITHTAAIRHVANEAIKRAIQDGDVLLPEKG